MLGGTVGRLRRISSRLHERAVEAAPVVVVDLLLDRAATLGLRLHLPEPFTSLPDRRILKPLPISDDPLYPVVQDVALDDFSRPLQLLASEVTFTDPIDGRPRRFESLRRLPLQGEASVGPE